MDNARSSGSVLKDIDLRDERIQRLQMFCGKSKTSSVKTPEEFECILISFYIKHLHCIH